MRPIILAPERGLGIGGHLQLHGEFEAGVTHKTLLHKPLP